MNHLLLTIAHAGEEHTETVESISHYIPEWYIAVPLFLIIISMLGYLIWIISGKKLDTVLLILAILMLICGFTAYVVSPAISVTAITIGIIFAGILAFSSLSE